MNHPLDPSIMLATSMQAQPGVYAVLVGSGVSRAAGIPTGWGVVEDLVGRIAAQSGTPLDSPHDAEAWWAEHQDGQLGYSTLLAALAPTAPARQGLLAPFFERDEDDEPDVKRPTAAHRAIAQLVKRGVVRVIVTTNFDRLIEQALTEVGIEPQVVSRPNAVAGMRPLAHAPATVVKLHGDYRDVDSLNTDDELARYPDTWNTLLTQILEEYGLVISGWSADWDHALVAAIENLPSRRYPLYWDSRSSGGGNAAKLLALRDGTVIETSGADEMFTRLAANLEALDELSEPPVTTAIAVVRLKKYLPDPRRRIDLFDLVQSQIIAAEQATEQVGALTSVSIEAVDAAISELSEASAPLLRLLVEGVFHDDGTHEALWVRTLQALLLLRTTPTGGFNNSMKALQHLPAQLALFAMGAVATAEHRDSLLVRLATEPTWQSPFSQAEPIWASQALNLDRVTDFQLTQALPRWGGTKWLYPQSQLVRALLKPVLVSVIPDDVIENVLDDIEYRIALLQWLHPLGSRNRPHAGLYVGEFRWEQGGGPYAEKRLRVDLARPAVADAYRTNDGFLGEQTLQDLREALTSLQRW